MSASCLACTLLAGRSSGSGSETMEGEVVAGCTTWATPNPLYAGLGRAKPSFSGLEVLTVIVVSITLLLPSPFRKSGLRLLQQ
jgi:hypothetical protein